MFAVVPVQALAIVYVAGILAATSRRSPVTSTSLAIGAITGLALGLAIGLAVDADSSDRYTSLLILGMVAMTLRSPRSRAWRPPGSCRRGIEDPQALRAAQTLQGVFAGSVAGKLLRPLATNLLWGPCP